MKDVNEALLSAHDALVREVERLYQQLLDPLQIAWLRTYQDELGIRPNMRAKTAVALRNMGYLRKHETDLLDRAAALAKRESLEGFDGRRTLRNLELSRAERELKERVDAELRRAAGIHTPSAPKKPRPRTQAADELSGRRFLGPSPRAESRLCSRSRSVRSMTSRPGPAAFSSPNSRKRAPVTAVPFPPSAVQRRLVLS